MQTTKAQINLRICAVSELALESMIAKPSTNQKQNSTVGHAYADPDNSNGAGGGGGGGWGGLGGLLLEGSSYQFFLLGNK